MKKNPSGSNNNNKSLKTFFVYSFLVFIIISISLSIRAFFILRQSRFDGSNVSIAVIHNKKVVSVMGIDTKQKLVSILDVSKANAILDDLPAKLGIIAESKIEANENLLGNTAEKIIAKSIYNSRDIKSDLTIIDKVRLILLSKSFSSRNFHLDRPEDTAATDKKITSIFTDNNIISENLSIQIINATEIPGLGQKLERVITNRGGNVVAVSSSRNKEHKSRIQYFGEQSYTIKKLKRILGYPVEKQKDKTIGDIAIIIGEDYNK